MYCHGCTLWQALVCGRVRAACQCVHSALAVKNKKCGFAKNKTLSGWLVWSAVFPICLFSMLLLSVMSGFILSHLFS